MDYAALIAGAAGVLASSGMWAYLDSRRKEKREDQGLEDAERRMVIALSRITIINQSLYYIKHGSISVEEADALTALYEPYKELHGNGNAERLFKQAINLPVRHARKEERT